MSNNDDFQDDHIDFDDDGNEGGFEDFEGGGTSLGDMWRNNPLVKIGVIAGGLVTVIGAIILFGGKQDPTLQSVVRPGRDVSAAPGDEISQAMRDAIVESNEQRTQEAVRGGGSAMPTPVDTPVQRLVLPEEKTGAEDPLERWRRIQEERQRQVSQQRSAVQAADPYADAIDALANAMAGQMEGILESKMPIEAISMNITDPDFIEQQRREERKEREAEAERRRQAGADGVTGDGEIVNVLIPAGTIAYAQLITEANSDAEGPILAQLVSGPFAGSRLLGTFEVEEEYLVLNFNSIVIDGIVHPTEAVALNPETTSIGMVTEIDHRYFTRVILPAAASFVEGMGAAIAESGSTTVVVDQGAAVQDTQDLDTNQEIFKGIEKSAETISEILDEKASNTEPMIRVGAGTPMGLLFVTPVTDEVQ